jgi:uncharacterized protein YbjT (DUF2867 family)
MPHHVVAGATGRVGAAVARELLARGEAPTLLVRNPERAARLPARGARAVVGSLDDGTLSRTLRGAAGLFTLLPENVPPGDFHGARRRLADSIAEAVRQSGVPHVVLLSAVAAGLADGNGPAKDLHYLEAALRGSGARLSALRACYFQDNVVMAMPAARDAGIYPSFFASPDRPIPMIAAEDVGRFAAEALLSPPSADEIVDLIGPACSIREVADALGAALGRPLSVVTVPEARHTEALVEAGVPLPMAEAIAEMFAAVNAGRIMPTGDRCLLGRTPIERTIAKYVSSPAPEGART